MVEIVMRRQGARLIPVDEFSADDLVRVPADQDVIVTITSRQNIKLRRFLWVLASKVADACDHLHDREDAMDELKIRARHVKYITNPVSGEVRIVPKSLTKLDGAGLSRLADRMIFIICRDILPGLKENTLKAEVERMIAGDRNSNPPRPPADAPAVTDPVSPDGGAAGATNYDSNGVPGNTPDDDGGGFGSAMEPTEENSGNDQTPPPRVSCGLPKGWEIVYAAALRRAQKKESLTKLAKQFWSQDAYAQFGGWAGVKQSLEGDIAIRIYDVFATNFGHAERIEDELREIL
jgi:hypothetical protein